MRESQVIFVRIHFYVLLLWYRLIFMTDKTKATEVAFGKVIVH
jgi:hypothetical protein